ncbi:hypothetical protein [Halorubrum tebenquichense]|uniref:hypothetical protein n=1 Tax=Halorubrum tebenquichense TaxID=119434 RepID=UPI0012685BEB|nr:hypothetical protein [Halorubrum tebenquichense]
MAGSLASKGPEDEENVSENPAPQSRPKIEEDRLPASNNITPVGTEQIESRQYEFDDVWWDEDSEEDHDKGDDTSFEGPILSPESVRLLEVEQGEIEAAIQHVDSLAEDVNTIRNGSVQIS